MSWTDRSRSVLSCKMPSLSITGAKGAGEQRKVTGIKRSSDINDAAAEGVVLPAHMESQHHPFCLCSRASPAPLTKGNGLCECSLLLLNSYWSQPVMVRDVYCRKHYTNGRPGPYVPISCNEVGTTSKTQLGKLPWSQSPRQVFQCEPYTQR